MMLSKRKIENDNEGHEQPCVNFTVDVYGTEPQTKRKEIMELKLDHKTSTYCFDCPHNQLDCRFINLLQIPISQDFDNLRVSITSNIIDLTSTYTRVMFNSFLGEKTFVYKLMAIKIASFCLSLYFAYKFFMRESLVVEGRPDRSNILKLVGRQLLLHVLVSDPFYFFVLYYTSNYL